MRAKLTPSRVRNVALSALCALLLTACGEKPEAMIASAKDYIAKCENAHGRVAVEQFLDSAHASRTAR